MRYESAVPIRDVHYCHCRMCQRAFGNVFALFGSFPLASFRFVSGAPRWYRSSDIAMRGFCERCGTPLVMRHIPEADHVGVSIGSLDHPEAASPAIHWGIESAVPWLRISDGLPRKPTEEDPEVAAAWARVRRGESS